MADSGQSGAVTFTGGVPCGEVTGYLETTDVAAAPFGMPKDHRYGPPTKLFEWMAAGRVRALRQVTNVIERGCTGSTC
jgi:hypothetical protein